MKLELGQAWTCSCISCRRQPVVGNIFSKYPVPLPQRHHPRGTGLLDSCDPRNLQNHPRVCALGQLLRHQASSNTHIECVVLCASEYLLASLPSLVQTVERTILAKTMVCQSTGSMRLPKSLLTFFFFLVHLVGLSLLQARIGQNSGCKVPETWLKE